MPARTVLHAAARRLFSRWPASESLSLGALDALSQLALWPFRRARAGGHATERQALVANTDIYNRAAEDYFAGFENRGFLLDKPFSDTPLLAKHLIDVGVLIDAMRLRPGDVVAEVGAGSCWLSHMLNRFGCSTIALDVSATAMALGRELFERDSRTNWALNPQFVAYDGHVFPLGDASCDRIVINDAFHHVPNQRELLGEMHRVLRGDGLVAMSEPGYGHAVADQSLKEAEQGVLENELVLEDVAALAQAAGFRDVTVMVASPLVRREIPARDLGAFMGGKHFARYWKELCSGLEQHHYIVLHKGSPEPTTRRPSRLTARIEIVDRTLIRITNIGDTRWLSGAGAESGCTRLGAHLYRERGSDEELVDFDWYRQELPHDVAPGQQIAMKLTLPHISQPGAYRVVFDLVVEGQAWFADRGSAPARLKVRC